MALWGAIDVLTLTAFEKQGNWRLEYDKILKVFSLLAGWQTRYHSRHRIVEVKGSIP